MDRRLALKNEFFHKITILGASLINARLACQGGPYPPQRPNPGNINPSDAWNEIHLTISVRRYQFAIHLQTRKFLNNLVTPKSVS